MTYVSLKHWVRGHSTLADFVVASSVRCAGHGAVAKTLTPIELVDDDYSTASVSGAALCQRCTLNLPNLSRVATEGWPDFTAADIEALWRLVEVEEKRDRAIQESRAAAVKTPFDGVEAALAAAQEARLNQASEVFAEAV